MSAIDNAIARLQALALASTDLTIKAAPNKPVNDAGVLPLAIAHLTGGSATAMDGTGLEMFSNVSVDFHFSRVSLKQAYTEIDACVVEYLKRLAGDPTLNSTIDTIIFPVEYTVVPTQWDSIQTQMLSFTIPIKTKETPIT